MKSTYKRKILTSSIVGLFLGILSASFMMYAAWDHNLQNEFHNEITGVINWSQWLVIGASWLFVIGISFVIITFSGMSLVEYSRKYIKK
jgi:hypothetical protein